MTRGNAAYFQADETAPLIVPAAQAVPPLSTARPRHRSTGGRTTSHCPNCHRILHCRACEIEFDPVDGMDLIEAQESALIRRAMAAAAGEQKQAARLLGITPRKINYLLAKRGLRPRDRRAA